MTCLILSASLLCLAVAAVVHTVERHRGRRSQGHGAPKARNPLTHFLASLQGVPEPVGGTTLTSAPAPCSHDALGPPAMATSLSVRQEVNQGGALSGGEGPGSGSHDPREGCWWLS